MICDNQPSILEYSDYACIGDVATHCIEKKLCIAESEARDFDLSNLFYDFWYTILEIIAEIDAYDLAVADCDGDAECISEIIIPENLDIKRNLICGGTYEGCNSTTRTHKGVKRILVYYSYARYQLINNTQDTATGQVRKTNEWSIPTPLKEIEMISDRYRSMGYECYKQTKAFLCASAALFPTFDACDCNICACDGKCKCGTTKAKGYGFTGGNISKKVYEPNVVNVMNPNYKNND